MKRPGPEAGAKDSPAPFRNIRSLSAKRPLNAGLLPGNKDVHIGPVHHFLRVVCLTHTLPANDPKMLDEGCQVGGRQVRLEVHMALKTLWIQAATWLVIPCGFL